MSGNRVCDVLEINVNEGKNELEQKKLKIEKMKKIELQIMSAEEKLKNLLKWIRSILNRNTEESQNFENLMRKIEDLEKKAANICEKINSIKLKIKEFIDDKRFSERVLKEVTEMEQTLVKADSSLEVIFKTINDALFLAEIRENLDNCYKVNSEKVKQIEKELNTSEKLIEITMDTFFSDSRFHYTLFFLLICLGLLVFLSHKLLKTNKLSKIV